MTTDANNLYAEETTNEILHNNKLLLDKQITPQVIKNIVENCCKSKKNKRFLNLLSSLCSCNNDAIPTNQDDICQLLLEEEKFESILMKIQTKKNGLQRVHSVIISDNAGNKNGIEEPPLYLEIDNIYDYYKQK